MNKAQKEALQKAGVSKEIIAALEKKSRAVNESLEGEIKREKTAAPAAATAKGKTETPATGEDVARALVKNPEFKTVLRDVLSELLPKAEASAEAAADEDEESTEETADEDAVAEPEAVAEETQRAARIESMLEEVLERLDSQEEDEEEQLRTLLADLPTRTKKQVIERPRKTRNSTIEPKARTLESQAKSVTERMREGRTS